MEKMEKMFVGLKRCTVLHKPSQLVGANVSV